MMSYQHETAITIAQRAQAIAAQLGLPEVVSEALNIQGSAAANMGADWTGQLRQALEIALSEGLDARAGRAYCNMYVSYGDQRRFAEGEQCYADGVAYCDDHDLTNYAAGMRAERASVLEKTGRWDEAAVLGEELLAGGGPAPVIRTGLLAVVGIVLARRGEPGAWAYLDEAMTYADRAGEAQQIVPVRLARAEARWLAGKKDLARREAELADDVCADSSPWDRGAVGAWLRRAGSARPARGEVAEPYRCEIEGDWEKAARIWTDLGCPYESALALRSGTDEAALREALRLFDGLGAVPAGRLTREKMRLLGIRAVPVGPRSATRTHPHGLTRREQEVLELICSGRTNTEIAGRLFISARTVDHHVSAVLAKLHAPTRSAAARRAAELGLGAASRSEGTPPG